jgi:hypothetical protein
MTGFFLESVGRSALALLSSVRFSSTHSPPRLALNQLPKRLCSDGCWSGLFHVLDGISPPCASSIKLNVAFGGHVHSMWWAIPFSS